MNTILNILPWLIAIACAALYLVDRIKLTSLKKSYEKLDNRYVLEERYNLEKNLTIDSLKNELSEVRKELKVSTDENNILKSKVSLLEDLTKVGATERINEILEPVLPEPIFRYKGAIYNNSLQINISLLIGDNRLFDVFKRLLNSNLLPESIKERLDFKEKELTIIIWTQEFDEDGHPIKCLSWKQILDQMTAKKQLITEYLQEVIQESNRAMVVHQALSEKTAKDVNHA
ncbi:MAG TPA: hypothetical protein DCL81_00895 [Algoriphagus sp.]|jgi:hypothetical protein|uniref:hypothetical protein n=1 Tax=Algoriphagus sp. TaxID=1872435 RepID=UPI000C690546|nr:hypothetical protein [Algoriphagus sp.]MAL13320.1 hypothetical protein [Algoriphagus sp.]MAN85614.1 hypothetical protein [Algoriphagus sp.]HAH35147.1 hypothetical protein [Algoriphagus sp.]HAS57942.1 hypothetical protein [Algoriphagus sp.]HCB47233.1 hypothetical protein [Algoriphagus sp.]|tara:strand:- start:10765 stop:11457 length:693 start_codon:yes stop_codon:yes gene_type:complete